MIYEKPKPGFIIKSKKEIVLLPENFINKLLKIRNEKNKIATLKTREAKQFKEGEIFLILSVIDIEEETASWSVDYQETKDWIFWFLNNSKKYIFYCRNTIEKSEFYELFEIQFI